MSVQEYPKKFIYDGVLENRKAIEKLMKNPDLPNRDKWVMAQEHLTIALRYMRRKTDHGRE